MAGTKYTVKQGDCISSIAFEHNLFPDTIWDHADNADLKKERKDPNALLPGDVVVIPDKELKQEQCAAEKKHRFKRKGVPEKLRIQFLSGDEEDDAPRKGVPYTLDITTQSGRPVPQKKGKTDDEGFLEETIPPDAAKGIIVLEEGEGEEVYEIMLGHIDPTDTITGLQARLDNLGYDCADEDGVLGSMTKDAVRDFQADNDLEVLTGDFEFADIEQDTLDKLEEMYSGE